MTRVFLFAGLVLLILPLASVVADADEVKKFGQRCGLFDYKQFNVGLISNGSSDSRRALCDYVYSRCPFSLLGYHPRELSDVGASKYLARGDWETEADVPFEWLESRTFYIPEGETPRYITVEETRKENFDRFNCARALNKDQFRDFRLGDANDNNNKLNIEGWWDTSRNNPLQITVVPYTGIIANDGKCRPVTDDYSFDTKRSIAIFLSPNAGQTEKPTPATGNDVYCDISKNPGDCLQESKWTIEDEYLVLGGTLKTNIQGNIDIYIPEGWDLTVPITTSKVRFKISTDSQDACENFANDPTTRADCRVDYAERETDVIENRVYITGLGRIDGYEAAKSQNENNWDGASVLQDTFGSKNEPKSNNVNIFDYKDVPKFIIDSSLLIVSSKYYKGEFGGDEFGGGDDNCGSSDSFAINVAGPTVAWGTKLGSSAVALNSLFVNEKDSTENYCVRLFDFKLLGNWIDAADGPDLMGKGSRTEYTYTQTNDDNIKVAVDEMVRSDSTVIQGGVGSVVMIGSYGKTRKGGVAKSIVERVYVHRILQNRKSCGTSSTNTFASTGGMVSTRSCGQKGPGLVDVTVKNLNVPALGSNKKGANSVGQPFGIGVYRGGGFCDGENLSDENEYPIKNLKFLNFNIEVNPACNSNFYDDSNVVKWGDGTTNTPSVQFYDTQKNDQCRLDSYTEAVKYSKNRNPYYVCGFPPNEGVYGRCIGTNVSNIDYNRNFNSGSSLNINIKFPTCNGRRRRRRMLRQVVGEEE